MLLCFIHRARSWPLLPPSLWNGVGGTEKIDAFLAAGRASVDDISIDANLSLIQLLLFKSPTHYTPLYTPIHPYTPLYTPIQPYTPLYTLIYPYTPLYAPIHPYTLLYTPIHPYTPLYTPTHPYTPLYTPIHPYTPLYTLYTPRMCPYICFLRVTTVLSVTLFNGYCSAYYSLLSNGYCGAYTPYTLPVCAPIII